MTPASSTPPSDAEVIALDTKALEAAFNELPRKGCCTVRIDSRQMLLNEWLELGIRAYLSHASVTPPEGYVLVPREPTRAMIDAGDAVDRPAAPYSGYAEERASAEAHYRAMISASPVAGKGK